MPACIASMTASGTNGLRPGASSSVGTGMRPRSDERSVPMSTSARSSTESAEHRAWASSNQRYWAGETRSRSRRSGAIISPHLAIPLARMNSRHSRARWIEPPRCEAFETVRLSRAAGRRLPSRRPTVPPTDSPTKWKRSAPAARATSSASAISPSSDQRKPGPGTPERPKPSMSKRATR